MKCATKFDLLLDSMLVLWLALALVGKGNAATLPAEIRKIPFAPIEVKITPRPRPE